VKKEEGLWGNGLSRVERNKRRRAKRKSAKGDAWQSFIGMRRGRHPGYQEAGDGFSHCTGEEDAFLGPGSTALLNLRSYGEGKKKKG